MTQDIIAVLGLGKTGFSCVEFLLLQQNYSVIAVDTREQPPSLAEFKSKFPNVPIYLRSIPPDVIKTIKEMVVSPGVSIHDPLIQTCQRQGISIIGDIELFARYARAPIAAITGTNAKSTVTSLLGEMAHQQGLNVKVGANLGTPAVDLIAKEVELYVLELSSFQLETTYNLPVAVATILNVTPDHLDRYTDFNEYCQAKQLIYNKAEVAVFNRDDANTKSLKHKPEKCYSFGVNTPNNEREFGLCVDNATRYLAQGDELLLPVMELAPALQSYPENALAALAMGTVLGLPIEKMIHTLQYFRGLPHRCELIGIFDGVRWYNDSKATNIGAVVAAIKNIAPNTKGKVVLIAGGQGKGVSFAPLRDTVQEYVDVVVLLGEDAEIIASALAGCTKIEFAKNMQDAVIMARRIVSTGDVVLLSPACASFDMFKNYAHRGEVFTNLVKEIVA